MFEWLSVARILRVAPNGVPSTELSPGVLLHGAPEREESVGEAGLGGDYLIGGDMNECEKEGVCIGC